MIITNPFEFEYEIQLTSLTKCFYESEIEIIDKFIDTSKVTDMNWMFYNCRSLTSLNLSSFDTSNVTNMYHMFDGCSMFNTLDLSNFNISKCNNFDYMFNNCSQLKELNLSTWKIASTSYSINNMFTNCTSLKTIRMCGCDAKTVDIITKALKYSLIENVNIITTC